MHPTIKKILAICESVLLPSIALIPLLKIITLVLKINLPLQYTPTIILTLLCLINQKKNWFKIFFLNVIILFFCIIAYDLNKPFIFELPIIKNQAAALLYLNVFLIGYFLIRDNQKKNYFKIYAPTLLWSTVAVLALCHTSLINAIINNYIQITLEDIKSLLVFSRTDIKARSELIAYINPVRLIAHDYENMKMVGPQLLINPLILFLFTLIKREYFNKYLLSFTLISSIPLYFALNSRTFVLIIILAFIIVAKKNINKFLHKIVIVTFSIIPIIVTNLNSILLNGRKCQIEFVKNNLSIFGNGIASKQNELNSVCGAPLNIQNYQIIQSITFDNIHIEAIHYFGYVPYLALFFYLVYRGTSSNTYQTRLFFLIIFVFFSLNLNLFEIYFLPLFILLTNYCIFKEDNLDQKNLN